MVLNIKDPETDRVARELSAATGESITVAVRIAMQERLRRVRSAASRDDLAQRLEEIVERGRVLPILDTRTPEEIVGYDEDGLPA